MAKIIDMQKVRKVYQTGAVEFVALKGIDCQVEDGEFVAIVGPSGSGKSTMMNLMGCLDVPTDGTYTLDGRDVGTLSSNELADIRNKKVGFVFQAFNLLPYATAYENIEIPLLFGKVNGAKRKRRVTELLARMGLSDKANNRPTEMSGGEMQRVAIARALANEPRIILADEPTGNLDTASGEAIVKLFDELHASGKTIIMITHDMNIARNAQRVIKIRDGQIESNGNHA